MITLAFDTASDRCTVAATDGSAVAHRHIDGARTHAGSILSLLDEALTEIGAVPRDVTLVVTGDGPGSFTGLRVSSAVAKALAWGRRISWRTAPSLLVRAAAHAGAGGSTVLAFTDALRGDLYAGCWRFGVEGVIAVGPSPRAVAPDQLVGLFGRVDLAVGTVPAPLLAVMQAAVGCAIVSGEAALPDARTLLALAGVAGGTILVQDPASWEPVYGRPAEAQAVWERTHGRPLPSAPGLIR